MRAFSSYFWVKEPAAAGVEAAESFTGVRFALPAERAERMAVAAKRPYFGRAFLPSRAL